MALLEGIQKADSSPVNEFSQEFIHSLLDEPCKAIRQLQGASEHSTKAHQVDNTPIGSSRWLAKQVGSCLGSLPWYLATHSAMGTLVRRLSPQASAFRCTLTSSALTGFTVDAFLKSTDVDRSSNNFVHQRLANGLSGALTFASMSAMAGCVNSKILGSVDTLVAEKHLGNSAIAQLLRSKAVSNRLAGSISGAAVGAPTGFIAAHSNSLFKEGTLAKDEVVAESMLSSSLIGAGFGAFNKVKSPEITLRKNPAHQEFIVAGAQIPRPLLKVGTLECYRESDITNLEKSIQHLKSESSTDALTNLPNNRAGEIVLKQNFDSSRRNNRPLSLLFLDLDGFKAVNDKAGHDQGDLVLQEVARKLRNHCRRQDTIYRKGGDEFVAILPETTYEGARKIARQIQEIVKMEIDHPNEPLKVGTSLGIYTYEPWQSTVQSITELLRAADQLMYTDKQMRKASIARFDNRDQTKPSQMPSERTL